MRYDWILMAPQYHFVMGIVGLACLVFIIKVYFLIKNWIKKQEAIYLLVQQLVEQQQNKPEEVKRDQTSEGKIWVESSNSLH